MKKISWTCDCCGAEIKKMPIRIESYLIDRETEEPEDTQEILGEVMQGYPLDICEACAEDCMALCWQHIKEAAALRGKTKTTIIRGKTKTIITLEPEEPAKKPEEADDGRIRALWEAGWTETIISEEIGESEETVRSLLKEMGLWKPGEEREAELAAKNKEKEADRTDRMEFNGRGELF